MSHPTIRNVVDVVRDAQRIQCGLRDGRYVPARSEGSSIVNSRVKAAWLVFTGKADALIYPGQP
jgi:hypothetical protein